jgi:transcription antitermination factor NusG
MLRQWSDRKKRVEEPLFKSYLFINIAEEDRHLVFQSPGVMNYLFFDGRPAIVRDQEIEAIKVFCGEVSTHQLDFSFEEGAQLSIHSGPFKGAEGEFLARKGNQLILLIESLGQVIRARVPAHYVLPDVIRN